MFYQVFENDNSYIELRNRIEIIKLKKIIENSSLDEEFKEGINDYLFINDMEFNRDLSKKSLHLENFTILINNIIEEFEGSTQDLSKFKNEIKIKADDFYNSIEKPVIHTILENLPMKNAVYYTTPYIVLDNRTGDRLSEISQGIYDYKEHEQHINYFTKELMKAISFLANDKIDEDIENIALVCLPRSSEGLESTIQQSIDIIEKWYSVGKTDLDYDCSKKIINCKGLLTRFKTIEQSSKGANLDESDHLNSIECKINSNIDLDNTAFILLDDITTHGTIMRACRKLLTDKNVKFRNIYMLAIGGTRSY